MDQVRAERIQGFGIFLVFEQFADLGLLIVHLLEERAMTRGPFTEIPQGEQVLGNFLDILRAIALVVVLAPLLGVGQRRQIHRWCGHVDGHELVPGLPFLLLVLVLGRLLIFICRMKQRACGQAQSEEG